MDQGNGEGNGEGDGEVESKGRDPARWVCEDL